MKSEKENAIVALAATALLVYVMVVAWTHPWLIPTVLVVWSLVISYLYIISPTMREVEKKGGSRK